MIKLPVERAGHTMSGHAAGQRLGNVRGGMQGVIVTEPGEAEPTAEDDAAGHAAGSSDDDAGGRYGGALARDLLRTFREDTGRDAETVDELADWMMRRNAEALERPGQRNPSTD